MDVAHTAPCVGRCGRQVRLLIPLCHCSPAKVGEAEGEATDRAGWERYGTDWRNYFECMLAPVAKQAAGQPPGIPCMSLPYSINHCNSGTVSSFCPPACMCTEVNHITSCFAAWFQHRPVCGRVLYAPSQSIALAEHGIHQCFFCSHARVHKAEPTDQQPLLHDLLRSLPQNSQHMACMVTKFSRQQVLREPFVLAAALERLDVVAAPAPSKVAPLEAVLSALRATQQALEATQMSTFGTEVTHPLPSLLVPPFCLK